jgi:hypothetical protein
MPWPNRPALTLHAALGVDVGQMYTDSVGAQLRLVYRLGK